MDLKTLGYTQRWMDMGYLTEENLAAQLDAHSNDKSRPTAEYRYATLLGWIDKTDKFENKELVVFLEICKADKDKLMGGTAAKELFLSPSLTSKQFELVKIRFSEFGDWTQKVILREELSRRLEREPLTEDLFEECLAYKTHFKDNRFVFGIISATENPKYLQQIAASDMGKKIRTAAQNKLNQLTRSSEE